MEEPKIHNITTETTESTKKKKTDRTILLTVIIAAAAAIGICLYMSGYISPNRQPVIPPQESALSEENIETSAAPETSENTSGDTTGPIIALRGSLEITLAYGAEFTDPGYSAADYIDGPLTDQVVVTGSVDTHKVGTYEITYQTADYSGNITQVVRTIHVIDEVAPELILNGDADIYLPVGQEFSDPGYTCIDNADGDLLEKVTVTGSVNSSEKGANQLTYSVTDASGNTSALTRTVYMFYPQEEDAAAHPENKLVYLTFDDGPSKHTLTLLDILDKFGVKATFFVTNQYPYNNDTIGLSHDKGHTIALHTYSHEYSKIYKNEKNYFADLEKISAICETQTGIKPTIIRFPGGTSNSISKKYKKGIMSDLIESVEEEGYVYCDWNVDSGDAAGAKTAKEVSENVISGIQKHDISIVLQHDTSSYSVKAVEAILYWGLENGCTFLPMTDDMEMIHFPPKN